MTHNTCETSGNDTVIHLFGVEVEVQIFPTVTGGMQPGGCEISLSSPFSEKTPAMSAICFHRDVHADVLRECNTVCPTTCRVQIKGPHKGGK